MSNTETTAAGIARLAIDALPADADRDVVLAAFHQHLTVQRDVKMAESLVEARKQTPQAKSGWWGSELFG